MRKRRAFAGIFALNFKKEREFLLKNSQGRSAPKCSTEHFNSCIILRNVTKLKFCRQLPLPCDLQKANLRF